MECRCHLREYKNRGVIHAQGARIRAQAAPGYAHKEQAYKRDDRLTGVFTSQKGNSTSESGHDAKAVRTRNGAVVSGVFTSQKGNSTSESGHDAKAVRTRNGVVVSQEFLLLKRVILLPNPSMIPRPSGRGDVPSEMTFND
jgi:hypothetical protein